MMILLIERSECDDDDVLIERSECDDDNVLIERSEYDVLIGRTNKSHEEVSSIVSWVISTPVVVT